jgi:hypothetical protein
MIARPEAAALEPLLEQLGLRQAAAVLPDWLDRAASQELSYADFLHGLLEEQSVARANAATQKLGGDTAYPSEWARLTEIVRRAMQIGKRALKELEASREGVQLVRRLVIEPSAGVRPSA